MAKKYKISLKRMNDTYFAGPLFMYVSCKNQENSSDPIEIDEMTRNLFLLCAGNKDLVYKQLQALFAFNEGGLKCPEKDDIEHVAVCLYDNDDDALAGGNDDVDVWTFNTKTHMIDWDSYDPNEWVSEGSAPESEDEDDCDDSVDDGVSYSLMNPLSQLLK